MLFIFKALNGGSVKLHSDKMQLPNPWTFEVDKTQDGRDMLVFYCKGHIRAFGFNRLHLRRFQPDWADVFQEATADIPDIALLGRWMKLLTLSDRTHVNQDFKKAVKYVRSLPTHLRVASRHTSYPSELWTKKLAFGLTMKMYVDNRIEVTWDERPFQVVVETPLKAAA